MSKLKSTVKVNNAPAPFERGNGTDNGFIFSDNILDWQRSKKRQYGIDSHKKAKKK